MLNIVNFSFFNEKTYNFIQKTVNTKPLIHLLTINNPAAKEEKKHKEHKEHKDDHKEEKEKEKKPKE